MAGCQCRTFDPDDIENRNTGQILYCQLHKAAPTLLKALKLAEEWHVHHALHGCDPSTCADGPGRDLAKRVVATRRAAIEEAES